MGFDFAIISLMDEPKKYSVVIYWEGDALNRVRHLQKEISDLTGSVISYNNWSPHITVSSAIVIKPE